MLVGVHTSDYTAAKAKVPDLKLGREFFGVSYDSAGVPFTTTKFLSQLNSSATELVAAGLDPYLSFKFPQAKIINGSCDPQLIAGFKYLQTLTAGGCHVYATSHHEPENDMTAAVFVAQFDHCYALKQQYAPNIHFGVVNMGYQWRSVAARPLADQRAWMSFKKADFVHNDVYSPSGDALRDLPKWTVWLNAVQLYSTCKTIGLAERGYNAKADQVNVMHADQVYLDSLAKQGLMVDVFAYWDSMDTNGVDSYKLSTAGWAQLAAFAKSEAKVVVPVTRTHPPSVVGVPAVCNVCYAILEDGSKAAAHYSALHP